MEKSENRNENLVAILTKVFFEKIEFKGSSCEKWAVYLNKKNSVFSPDWYSFINDSVSYRSYIIASTDSPSRRWLSKLFP